MAAQNMKWLLAAPLALLLTACGGGETPQPGGLSRDESDALNDAAEMLDAVNEGKSAPEPRP